MLATVFILLNLADAHLTKAALPVGATEANPLMAVIGSNIIVKGLLATAVVFILY